MIEPIPSRSWDAKESAIVLHLKLFANRCSGVFFGR